jgi:hypothetical protein
MRDSPSISIAVLLYLLIRLAGFSFLSSHAKTRSAATAISAVGIAPARIIAPP